MADFEVTLYRDVLDGSQPIVELAENLAREFGIDKQDTVSFGDSGEARVALFTASGEMAKYMVRRNSLVIASILDDDERRDTVGVGLRGNNLPGVKTPYRKGSASYVKLAPTKPTKFEGVVTPEDLTRELLLARKAAEIARFNVHGAMGPDSISQREFKPINLVRFRKGGNSSRPTIHQARYPKSDFETRIQLTLGPIRMLIGGIAGMECEVPKETFGVIARTNDTR